MNDRYWPKADILNSIYIKYLTLPQKRGRSSAIGHSLLRPFYSTHYI